MTITEHEMNYNQNLLEHAKEIAIATHIHGVDKAGEPYLEHIVRVAESLQTTEEKIAGYLHDVLEDCQEELRPMLLNVLGLFPDKTLNTIKTLTREIGERYEDYIDRIINSNDVIAIKVKIADMTDNLRETEDIVAKSLAKRYNKFLPKLKSKLDEMLGAY